MKYAIIALFASINCVPLSLLALDVPKEIEEIDGYVANLEHRVPQMDKHEKNIMTGTDGGGALSAFFSDKSLRKSELKIGLSSRNIENIFYYRESRIILIVSKEFFSKVDRETGVADPTQIEGNLEERYYFSEDQQLQFVISFRDRLAVKRDATESKRADYLLRLSHVIALSARSKDPIVDLESLLKAE